MHRRTFVRLLAASSLVPATPFELRAKAGGTLQIRQDVPPLKIVSSYAPAKVPGMPDPFPGRVIAVKSDKSVDTSTGKANDEVVREMMARGMRALTGAGSTPDAWRHFLLPRTSSASRSIAAATRTACRAYEIVAETVRQLTGIGVPVSQIFVYERFQNQMDEVNYAPHLAEGVQHVAAERANRYSDNSGYDPATYLEATLFGEEDTRSNMMRLVSKRLTKIINIPNMKDHGATGVTGCLKNIAYGSFSNVARTHQGGKSYKSPSSGHSPASSRCARERCCRSSTACARSGTPAPSRGRRGYVFYPRQIMFGTDPVAIDRLLLDIIDDKHRAEGAISVWDRSPASLKTDDTRARDADPNVNIIIREPGHIEYASTLGLGCTNRARISVQDITV